MVRACARIHSTGSPRLIGPFVISRSTNRSASTWESATAVCRVIIATGGGTHRHKKYACSRRFNRGGCENDLYIRRDDLEELLLGKLQGELLRPVVIDYAVEEFQRQLEVALTSLSGDLG